MDKNKPDADLIRRMMMGDFSPSEDEAFAKENASFQKQSGNQKEKSIDLHFEKLHPDKAHLPKEQKLEMQLSDCEFFIEKCIKKNVRKAIIIHGIGDDSLKKAVHRLLKNQACVQSFSVSTEVQFQGGATLVWFR